jgi:hypothetical protein
MSLRRSLVIGVAGVVVWVSAFSGLAALGAGVTEATTESPCPASAQRGAIRMAVSPVSVSPGQALRYRIDNSAGPTITYGTPYSVQVCLGGVWVLAPFSPQGPWTKQRIRQGPSHGRQWSVQLPDGVASGAYRIRKEVATANSVRWLYAPFSVVP